MAESRRTSRRSLSQRMGRPGANPFGLRRIQRDASRRGSINVPTSGGGLRDLLESLDEGPRRSRGGRRTSPLGRGEIESIEVGVALPERTRRRPQLTARQRRIRARRRKERQAEREARSEERSPAASATKGERGRGPLREGYSRDSARGPLRGRHVDGAPASIARPPRRRGPFRDFYESGDDPSPRSVRRRRGAGRTETLRRLARSGAPRRQSSRTRANQSQILERRAPSRRSRPEPRPERTSRRNDFSYEGASNAGDRAFRRLRDAFRSQVPTPIRGRSTRSRRRPSRPARTRRAQPRVSRRNDFSYEGAANAGDRASRRLAGYFGR